MSYETIYLASTDLALQHRVEGGVNKEALNNPTFGMTPYGQQVIAGTAAIWTRFAYPIAVDTEAAYESAIIAENPNPGGDPSVITDAQLLAAIQANWPAD